MKSLKSVIQVAIGAAIGVLAGGTTRRRRSTPSSWTCGSVPTTASRSAMSSGSSDLTFRSRS
jgi:hypothetical protein